MLPLRLVACRLGVGLCLALVLSCSHKKEVTVVHQDSNTTNPWYSDNVFLWKTIFTEGEYGRLTHKLPREQAIMMQSLSRFDLTPLDLRRGNDAPRITYMSSHSSLFGIQAAFPKLEYLDLVDNNVTDEILQQLVESKVICLRLPCRTITNAGLERLLLRPGSLPNLRHLDLWVEGQGVSSELLATLRKRPVPLESLQLSGRGVTDIWITRLALVKGLLALGLRETSVTEAGLRQLPKLDDLKRLALIEQTELSENALQSLKHCRRIEELQLWGQNVNNECVQHICAFQLGLTNVVIGDSSVTADGIRHLSQMKELRTVVFASRDKDAVSELRNWGDGNTAIRQVFTTPDPYFGGWLTDSSIIWPQYRYLDPSLYP